MDEFIGKDAVFVKDWLVRQGLEKLVDVLKICFLIHIYLFITCNHINISDHGELYFGYHKTITYVNTDDYSHFAFKTSQESFKFVKVELKHLQKQILRA